MLLVINLFEALEETGRELLTSCILRSGYTVGKETSTRSSIADSIQVVAPLYKKPIMFGNNIKSVVLQHVLIYR